MFAKRGYCNWRTLENFFFPPVHESMVHQFLPACESLFSTSKESLFCVQVLLKLAVNGLAVSGDNPSHFLFA